MSSDTGSGENAPPHAPIRGLSYELHTNRELELMLKGIKPLAYFSDLITEDYDTSEPDEEFERQVELGIFVKYETCEFCEPYTLNGRLIKGRWTRFYALKDEAWRIPAFILLKGLMNKHPWSDPLERMEGSLLGYTDEQNDEWLTNRRNRHAGWHCATLYAITTSEVLNRIADLGNRAFPKGCLPELQLFTAPSIPSRLALEQSGLSAAGAGCGLIRFGVHRHFLEKCLERTPSPGIALASIRPGVEARHFNIYLRTDIQVLEPK